jgi:hypothetical protein
MSDWIKHVKQYAKMNKCTFGEALKKAAATFKKGPSSPKTTKKRSRKNRGTRRRGKK